MDLILVDSSVWINLLKGVPTKSATYLRDNADNLVLTTCPVIVQEVLQGVRKEKDFVLLKQRFAELFQLPCPDPYVYALKAADLYRSLRKKGITIRKANDCLIAVYAMQNDLPLLFDDSDFTAIATHSKLRTAALKNA